MSIVDKPYELAELLDYWRTFPASSNEVAAAQIIEELQRRLARLSTAIWSERLFPILCPHYINSKVYVPWDFVAQHKQQAEKNHGQTLTRLAERGGLSVSELCAVIEDREWFRMDDETAWRSLYRAIFRTPTTDIDRAG